MSALPAPRITEQRPRRWGAWLQRPSVRLAAATAVAAMAAVALPPAAIAATGDAAPPLQPGTRQALRIVTLAPHATELVYAAGGGDFLVGTVSSSDFPDAARALPRVGDGILLNQERLVVLEPTHILAWRRFGAAVPAEALADTLGAHMVYLAPHTLRDIPAAIRRLGTLLGTQTRAGPAAGTLERRIEALEHRYSERAPVTVFIEAGHLPLYTIGNDPLLNDALRICGAVNIYGQSAIAAPRVPVESVLVHDPQLLVAPAHEAHAALQIRHRWAKYGLQAAQRGHVHIADPDALFRPGPRLVDATEALCAAIDAARTGAGLK